ncbi:MAG: hypothetical protein NZ602_04875 [Thermoguttaceae bacterium]|nr:hypothetical protein [Thermoguttaceae bacterium]MDW8039671.1 hypothetical protein [Thermoguttaceae bacterium]
MAASLDIPGAGSSETTLVEARQAPASSRKSEQSKQAEGSPEGTAEPGTRTIRIWGDIGVHPTDRAAACQEAEQNAHQKLYEQLGEWAEQLTGQKPSARRLVVEHAWLLAQPGVRQHQQMQVEEKSHGWVARQEITLSVPTQVLERWANRLDAQKQQRTRWLAWAALATLLGWLVGLWVMVRWDRATGGYYRTGVVLGSLLVLGTLTGLGWWLLWGQLYLK